LPFITHLASCPSRIPPTISSDEPYFPNILLICVVITTFAAAQTVDYWHTAGNQIYNSSNQAVRIAGVNWYGFETTDEVAHGLWAQDYHSILNTIKSNGYSVIRMPLSNQMVETPIVPTNISYNNSSGPINTDLINLNSLQLLDKLVSYAGQIGLRIILDNHRSEAGSSAEANGLWYTTAYPESAWINDWNTLASRYLNNSTVIGFDLRNEPHNATSGGSSGVAEHSPTTGVSPPNAAEMPSRPSTPSY
jgi:endoglucanase